MDYTKEESDFEKTRKENIKRNEEEFQKLFPAMLLKPFKDSPRTTEVRRARRNNLHSIVQTITPRESLRRSCKREREPSLDTFSDSDDGGDDEVSNGSSGSAVVVKFGQWNKKFKSLRYQDDVKDKDFIYDGDSISDDEHQEEGKKRKSKTPRVKPQSRVKAARVLRPFDAVTEEDLILVADRTSDKRYDQVDGTSCHQCRQKTDDLKTVCRSGHCVGIRGQFCGPCLKNRYGECAKEAIMNATWQCPPCRGICNCSFCMKKRGRRATGIMIHAAKQSGYTDVSSFLGLKEKVVE
ncbi:cell division cycle-associated 7-like protein [Clytia hemisphaerica]|uniref:Zinc-finger domain-containing protein n=1 Tax=Clytia hemisphaerica TaxID=252671 RepID=A0A7M5VEP3_9CNID